MIECTTLQSIDSVGTHFRAAASRTRRARLVERDIDPANKDAKFKDVEIVITPARGSSNGHEAHSARIYALAVHCKRDSKNKKRYDSIHACDHNRLATR